MSTLYLSFANFINGKIDTALSGNFAVIPAEGQWSWIETAYTNWTRFKFYSPNTKIILSLGGATFDAIWTGMDDAKIEAMAQAVKAKLEQQYPVYLGSFADPQQRLGYVTIDGIDLDVELGGNSFTDELTDQVA